MLVEIILRFFNVNKTNNIIFELRGNKTPIPPSKYHKCAIDDFLL